MKEVWKVRFDTFISIAGKYIVLMPMLLKVENFRKIFNPGERKKLEYFKWDNNSKRNGNHWPQDQIKQKMK